MWSLKLVSFGIYSPPQEFEMSQLGNILVAEWQVLMHLNYVGMHQYLCTWLAIALRFSVELLVPDDENFAERSPMALSFRASFDMDEVYHNSFLKHAWGSEEIPYWFPLQRNEEFNITFQSDYQGFKVQGIQFWKHAVGTEVQQKSSHCEQQL